MPKHHTKLRKCIKCFRTEIFDDVKFQETRKVEELWFQDICVDCYPEEAVRIISERNKKSTVNRLANLVYCPYNIQD